ncbi:MAG: AAA family ATPase [Candidatus Saccharimonadales bacterium]
MHDAQKTNKNNAAYDKGGFWFIAEVNPIPKQDRVEKECYMSEHLLQFSAAEAEQDTMYDVSPKHMSQELGASALTGFTVLGEVDGPWANIRQELSYKIVDQHQAIDAVIDALDISAARLTDDPRPMANLAFLGPTGVGKSETAKVLAGMFGLNGSNLVKIDCSDFSNGHEVANLTGSPKGYIGSEDEPRLSKDRVERYGTVVLFDEIEKGSKELYNLMLQIMGDGKLQLSSGEVADFKHTIIVLTSNLGAQEMAESLNPNRLGFNRSGVLPDRDAIETIATKAFKEFFKPEFVNRLDRTVVFHPLSEQGLGRVLDTKLEQLNEEYRDMYGTRLSLSDATKQHLVDEALEESHMGARPLVRAFERQVQSTLGRYMGVNAIPEGTHVRVFHPSEAADGQERESLIFATERDSSLRRTVARTPAVIEESTKKKQKQAEQEASVDETEAEESGEE